jgi:RNA polymerase sigma-70 factor (ECF subfamily)
MDPERQNRFEGLLAPVLGQAFGTALQLTRSRDDAEDLVQEAAVQAYRAFDTFTPGTNFKAWFFRILVNFFYQRHRKRKREPEIAPLEDAPDLYIYAQAARTGLPCPPEDPASVVLGRLDSEAVGSAIAGLPEEYRIVCALYFIEDFAYQEIAEMVDCPVGTVRSRLHRGRKLLQRALWRLAEEQGIVPSHAP